MKNVAKQDAQSTNPQTLDALIRGYCLTVTRRSISEGSDFGFVEMDWDEGVPSPPCLASMRGKRSDGTSTLYVLIPSDNELKTELRSSKAIRLVQSLPLASIDQNSVFIPEAESYPQNSEIIKALDDFRVLVILARKCRDAKASLEDARHPSSKLYASSAVISEATPMLVDGLMRERGVSVFYGDMDEFKTTFILDMTAHISAGAPWQGRAVKHRPVIWYALEGLEELPVRLRALETKLNDKDTPWGNDRLPITALDRIPENRREWRKEICRIGERWGDVVSAREAIGDMPTIVHEVEGGADDWTETRYQFEAGNNLPIVVIDTLSIALGGEDEKGAKAVSFINDCLDLLKERPELSNPFDETVDPDKHDQWWNENGPIHCAVASHVIIIHHQTKTGVDFAGHRAIAADTHGLYRVHRFGKIDDVKRPFAGQLTPKRVKGIPRPAPMRFEVDVVPVIGTKQTAAILKGKSSEIPRGLDPVIKALRELETPEDISKADLNKCLDKVAKNRSTRNRYRERLEYAGILEEILDEKGKVTTYRFEDPTRT